MNSKENPFNYQEIIKRIYEVAETKNQIELAEILGIRQSSVSDAKRRNSIPAEWYVKLFEKFSVSPLWLKTGTGKKYVTFQDEAPFHSSCELEEPDKREDIWEVLFSGLSKETYEVARKYAYLEGPPHPQIAIVCARNLLPPALAEKVIRELGGHGEQEEKIPA